MGTVVATTGEIREIRTGGTRVGDDGVVTTRLGDYQICCGDETPQTWQERLPLVRRPVPPAPAARGAAGHTFAFRRLAMVPGGSLDIEAGGMSTTGSSLSEANPWNNGATAGIRTIN